MSSTVTLLSCAMEPSTAPAVCSASGRFSPRRRFPKSSEARQLYLQGLLAPTAPTLSYPTSHCRTSVTKVRFDLTGTQQHKDERDWRKVALADLWYTPQEIALMRHEDSELITFSRENGKINHQDPASWQASLRKAYQTMARASDEDYVLRVLGQQSPSALPPVHMRGMESASVTYIALDSAARRMRLYTRTAQYQRTISEPVVRANMLCETSRTLSRPARLLARHLAILAATNNENVHEERSR